MEARTTPASRLIQLRRIRWGVRGAFCLGVAASVTANVLHAVDNPISQTIAAWPPLALLLTVELISRVPVYSRALSVARILATATIAGIAAWVSYWHMAGVASRYGETGASPYLLPLSVDGLIVVASICLVELGGRIREAEQPPAAAQPDIDKPAAAAPKAPVFLAPISAPPALPEEPTFGAPAADDAAGQKVRQDARSAQQIEAAVRAMRAADPKLSGRKIADLLLVPATNVRRILQAELDATAAQPADNRTPELTGADR